MSTPSRAPRQGSPVPPRQPASGFRARYIRFCARPVVLAAAAAVLLAHRAVVVFDDPGAPQPAPVTGLTTRDIQARILVNLAIQLRGSGTSVRDVACARDSDTHASCVAAMSGEGPAALKLDVRIDPSSHSYEWLVVGRAPDAPAR
jgi:hypothetical protein